MRGLTLVEVLIAMGISIVVGALLVIVIINSAGLYTNQSSRLQEGLNINDTLAEIRTNIKQSSAIAPSYISDVTYTSSPTQLVLRVSSIDNLGNIIADTFDYYVYFLEGNTLHFKIFPDALSTRKSQTKIFSTNVNSVNFQYFDLSTPPLEVTPSSAGKIRISLTLRQKNGLNFETATATSEASLRND